MSPIALRERCRALHLSLSQLSQLSGLHEDSIRRVFAGETDPRLSTLKKLERALTAEEERLRRYLNGGA